jgi:phenylacetate-CoA ligase
VGEYWDPEHETTSEDALRKLQTEQIRDTITRSSERIPFYDETLRRAGINARDIRSLDDVPHLPFTTKSDLRYRYPLDFLAVPLQDVILVQATSGTSGRPVVVPYTSDDLAAWSTCMARALWAAGLRKDDVCLNAYAYGLFTGGLGFHHGAQQIGCMVIPTAAGMTDRQIVFMKDFGVTAIFCTPTYALTVAERAETIGVAIKSLPIRLGFFGAEPWTDEMRQQIEQRMGITAHEMYGLTEMMGPGVAFTCPFQRLHINEDYFYPEVIDPVTERRVGDGKRGELVLTTLQREAMPLVRYRTGDITALHRSSCDCGRTFVTMDRILGRTDDMVIISGIHCFPSEIESILLEFEELTPHYQIKLRKREHLDTLAVEAEVTADVYALGKKRLSQLEASVTRRLYELIGAKISVGLMKPGSIPRSEGKAKRVVDERKR